MHLPVLVAFWATLVFAQACYTSTSPPPARSSATLPTIWLAGDSTMAPGGGHNGTEGWGQYLRYSFAHGVRVNNSAYSGRSLRSFTREGRFAAIADKVTPGDWVVVEMGINDGSSIGPPDLKGRGVCPGAGSETCSVVYGNVSETVLTFPAYALAAAELVRARGAYVIFSAREPANPWESGNFSYSPDRFTAYARRVVEQLGGPARGVWFVDHGAYSAQAMRELGKAFVDGQFPMDHIHTAPLLADFVARAFVLGLKCGSAPLAGLVVNATSRLEHAGLGRCLPVDDTAPV